MILDLKKKPSPKAEKELTPVLSNWTTLNDTLMSVTPDGVRDMLVMELYGKRRLTIINRLATRLAMRAGQEIKAQIAVAIGSAGK